jgi:nifR3 family TIM-barrel protein
LAKNARGARPGAATAAHDTVKTVAITARTLADAWAIGDVRIGSRVVLAPMAGISAQAFRRQGRRFGAGLVCSEMVSACGLSYGNERTHGYLRIARDEHPLAVQIFGSEPALMAEAARMVVAAGADLVDINMGCPVRKVTRTGAGCSLLEQNGGDDAARIVEAVADAVDAPVMVKMRRGARDGSRTCLAAGPRLVEAGARCLTLHPRSAQQLYTGVADHSLTAELVDLVDVPVIASGDVTSRARAEAVLESTGCAAVMVARAAQGNPWLLRDLAHGEEPAPGDDEIAAELVRYGRAVTRELGERRAVPYLRKFHSAYLRHGRFPRHLRGELALAPTLDDVERLLFAAAPGAAALVALADDGQRDHADDAELALPVSVFGGG